MTKVCDCFSELKAITAARETRYRAHPDKPAPEGPHSYAEVKVTSIGQLNELVEAKRSGHKFIISEPVHVGGQSVAPSPLLLRSASSAAAGPVMILCTGARPPSTCTDGGFTVCVPKRMLFPTITAQFRYGGCPKPVNTSSPDTSNI